MKKCALFILCLLACTGVYAADDSKQVLVFRNSGEVNLFYAEDLDSIFCSKIDTAGIEYDYVVSQVFYTHDSAYVIPIAEIDSVVFGNRNEVEYKSDVRLLTQNDVSWIIRVDGNTIYFKTNTPSSILPQVGEKLFYPEVSELLPVGLSVTVISVIPSVDEIAVVVELLDLAEIFERFFYAGQIEDSPNNIARIKNIDHYDEQINLKGELKVGSYGTITTSGGLGINGFTIIDPLRHYYYANLSMTAFLGFNIELSVPGSVSHTFAPDPPIYSQKLPPVALIFIPSIDFNVFCELKAEMTFTYEMQRTYNYRVIWERRNGQNTITYPNAGNNGNEKDHAQIDITLNGSIYFGPEFNLNFNLVGDLVGVQANTKIGPELYGQISTGILQEISSNKYTPEVYASGEIGIMGKVVLGAYLTGREHGVWGDVERKSPLFAEYEANFSRRTLHLFPEFNSSRVVKEVSRSKPISVSATTKTKTQIERPLETGFQVLDKTKENVLDSIFVETLLPDTTITQGVAAEIELSGNINKNDTVYVRPIFHYAGYTIPYEFTSAAQGPGVMPITTFMRKNGVSVISGAPIIGQKTVDSTTLHIGSHLPVPAIDTFFVKGNPFASTIIITSSEPMLMGTWKGEMDSLSTLITFNADGIGGLKQETVQKAFTYLINSPTDGQLLLTLADQTTRVFTLKSLSALYLKVIDEQTGEYIKFTKKSSN